MFDEYKPQMSKKYAWFNGKSDDDYMIENRSNNRVAMVYSDCQGFVEANPGDVITGTVQDILIFTITLQKKGSAIACKDYVGSVNQVDKSQDPSAYIYIKPSWIFDLHNTDITPCDYDSDYYASTEEYNSDEEQNENEITHSLYDTHAELIRQIETRIRNVWGSPTIQFPLDHTRMQQEEVHDDWL